MVNELNNTISEAIGKLEKIVAIIEYLKFSIQDGMVNISDEAQKKQVLEALDKFTDIQKSNFKFIQAIEMLGSDMKLNLNALYPILPADVLRTVLGEQNNYEDLPEDLVSKIMGDESNNLNNSPVDDSIQKVSDKKNENNLMSQIMELAPKTESEVVTTPTEATSEVASEVKTPSVETTPEVTSEATTSQAKATPEATSEVKTPSVETTPEVTSEATTSQAKATSEATGEVKTPPVETTSEATSEVKTPPVETTSEATGEVKTPPVETTSEATGEVATPPIEVTSEAPNELDSIVLPSLDETPAENTTVESTSSTSPEDTVLLPLSDENNDTNTVSSEVSTENTTVESTSSASPEDTVLLPLSDENNEAPAEKAADGFELLPLEIEKSESDKSKEPNAVLPLDSTSLSEEKKDDSMVGENELVLPVLQQSLDIDEKPKANIASLDTSPVHAPLSFVLRGSPKILAVTPNQFSKLEGSLVSQMGNPEIAHILKFPSQDSHEASLGGMIQESEETTASLDSEKETDLETMMQAMEKAYSEGNIDVAERLSEKISKINKARQKTLSLSSAA